MNPPKLGDQPAFPATFLDQNLEGLAAREQFCGMTLREYYAGLAMQAQIHALASLYGAQNMLGATKTHEIVAELACCFSDALCAELSKEQKP